MEKSAERQNKKKIGTQTNRNVETSFNVERRHDITKMRFKK